MANFGIFRAGHHAGNINIYASGGFSSSTPGYVLNNPLHQQYYLSHRDETIPQAKPIVKSSDGTNMIVRSCNKIIKLDHNHFHQPQQVVAQNYQELSSTFNPYKNVMFSKHENSDQTSKYYPSASINGMCNPSCNIVTTLSDLPVFVTIEGSRIASYETAGEPHLCLPQLLVYLKEKFTLKRLVEKFEDSMVSFTSATPKQVDGLIKAGVIPPGANSCPLIKRSDADKICLGLYEQCFKGKTIDMVQMCSTSIDSSLSNTTFVNSSQITKISNNIKQQQFSRDHYGSALSRDYNHPHKRKLLGRDNEQINYTQLLSAEHSKPLQSRPCHVNCNGELTGGFIRLFENEAQGSIIALAKAATSTLMVRVYHRCFGKCIGLFYPALLRHARSKCIECATCRYLLSPRRFIGHTHGSKEIGVCHWGFNSYNWRHYIRLCHKQVVNNLDEDELLVKFRALQTVGEKDEYDSIGKMIENDEEDYEFDRPGSDRVSVGLKTAEVSFKSTPVAASSFSMEKAQPVATTNFSSTQSRPSTVGNSNKIQAQDQSGSINNVVSRKPSSSKLSYVASESLHQQYYRNYIDQSTLPAEPIVNSGDGTNMIVRSCNKIIKLDHNHFHQPQQVVAQNYQELSSTFNPYKNVMFSKHENSDHTSKYYPSASINGMCNPSCNIVTTLSDLPVFVTIEGSRIASYETAGEPHLCLPQLLVYLKEKFTLKRLVEKFEDSMVSFTSATPKQVDGLIKAGVIPPGANSCPLIKRSDADKICLGLYEQCFKGRTIDMVQMCSTNIDPFSSNTSAINGDFCEVMDKFKDLRHLQQISGNNHDIGILKEYNFTRHPHKRKLLERDYDQSNYSQPFPKKQFKLIQSQIHQEDFSGEKTSGFIRLFENEAQDSIIALAKAATSTLMVRVYHRCFGKCIGLFYPALLRHARSKCIECATCRYLLSPRRFIGHTHGSKEIGVCHWGFNSYHWRHYIRLCHKQVVNNLDEDELLVKFRALQTVSEKDEYDYSIGKMIENDEEDYEFDRPDRDEVSSGLMTVH